MIFCVFVCRLIARGRGRAGVRKASPYARTTSARTMARGWRTATAGSTTTRYRHHLMEGKPWLFLSGKMSYVLRMERGSIAPYC